MRAATSFVEDLLGPFTKGLGGERQEPMEGLKEPRELAADIGDDLVRVSRHETGRMDRDAMDLRRIGEAIPIALLHLPAFVRVEEEMASRRATR